MSQQTRSCAAVLSVSDRVLMVSSSPVSWVGVNYMRTALPRQAGTPNAATDRCVTSKFPSLYVLCFPERTGTYHRQTPALLWSLVSKSSYWWTVIGNRYIAYRTRIRWHRCDSLLSSQHCELWIAGTQVMITTQLGDKGRLKVCSCG